jgi:hypothetical protein
MLDLGERVGTIIKKVPRLPAVDPDHAQQQLSTKTQSHGRLSLADNILHIVRSILEATKTRASGPVLAKSDSE